MARTNPDTLRALYKTILTRLENDKVILMPAHLRQKAMESMESSLHGLILTEQDLHDRTIEKLGNFVTQLSETELTDNEQFKTAKAMLRRDWGENELHGIFFQKSLRDISLAVTHWIMSCPQIEDVFESDDVLEKKIVEIFQKFNPKNLH